MGEPSLHSWLASFWNLSYSYYLENLVSSLVYANYLIRCGRVSGDVNRKIELCW